jgi:hypothetical protein
MGRSAPNLGLRSDGQRQEQACDAGKDWCAAHHGLTVDPFQVLAITPLQELLDR